MVEPGVWSADARTKNPALVVGRVAGIFRAGFPNTFALLGLPAEVSASSGEVFGNQLSVLLGLSVSDFVKVHCFVLLSFCAFIIAH